MLYRPSPSVTTERTFSIRAGLAASTVTPGITAPDASRTTPEMPAACCAHALEGKDSTLASMATATLVRIMASLSVDPDRPADWSAAFRSGNLCVPYVWLRWLCQNAQY